MTPKPEADEVLSAGELTILGRIRSASNATFLCEAERDGASVHCVYKPVAGEQPLWDFPDGTLAGRELATYLVSSALNWDIVPRTIIRDGPAGPGMCQLWVEQPGDVQDPEESETTDEDDTETGPDLVDLCPAGQLPAGYLPVLRARDYAGDDVLLIHADDDRLRRMAVFDVLVNNADRKGGHILHSVDDHVFGVDHGLCLHVEDKLRTVLWGWAGKPVDDETLEAVAGLVTALDGELAEVLSAHITPIEVIALEDRARSMLDTARMPTPDRHRPIPWPAF
ncbi:MAG: SCO1664 family protein [Mycobacterium sp.]